jgi:hypothetical protein
LADPVPLEDRGRLGIEGYPFDFARGFRRGTRPASFVATSVRAESLELGSDGDAGCSMLMCVISALVLSRR